MVLSTEWSQVEIIDLVNDGSGLGFGIVGGRSTGVVIKSILPGGIADKDICLQSGDHILQIGDVNLRGLAADQVATVLRQAGAQVVNIFNTRICKTSLNIVHCVRVGCSCRGARACTRTHARVLHDSHVGSDSGSFIASKLS